jgi:hypothetical protein
MQAFLRPLYTGTVPGAPAKDAVGTSSGDSPRRVPVVRMPNAAKFDSFCAVTVH